MRPAPSRFAELPEQYFVRILAATAAARNAPGPRFIDLGRGNPDLPPPEHALEAARAGIAERTSAVHGYPPFRGLPALREALAARYAVDHGVDVDPELEVAVVPGTKWGIIAVAQAAAGPGDDVLVPDPGYPDYRSGVALAGATPVPLPLVEEDAYQPHFEAIADHGRKVALTLLNYPSNPCSTCEQAGTFEAAVAFAQATGSWLMHDLAYGFLAFDGRRARSVLEVDGAREVAVELWSTSKIYGMAGWRLGFVVGNAELVERVKLLADHVLAGIFVPLQRAAMAAMTGDTSHVAARRGVYLRRRDRLVAAIRAAGGVITAPEGTFYAWWRLPDGVDAEHLATAWRIGVAPGEGFGARGRGHVRLSLATADPDLDEACSRLASLLRGDPPP